MTNPGYAYRGSDDQFYGCYDTPEAAALEGLENSDDDEIEVGEAVTGELSDWAPDLDDVFEIIGEQAYDDCGEVTEGWPHIPSAQERELAEKWFANQFKWLLRRLERKFGLQPTHFFRIARARTYVVTRRNEKGFAIEVALKEPVKA